MKKCLIYLTQLSIICTCWGLGEFIVYLTDIQFPPSILGMLILTTLLYTGVLKLRNIKHASDALLHWLPMFFIPPGVAVILYFDLICDNITAIILSVIISTIFVMWLTGQLFSWTRRIRMAKTMRRRYNR